MPTKQFFAVTPSHQWCCANCGSDYDPSYSGKYEAVVSKHGPAKMIGPNLFPPTQPQREIETVGQELSFGYTCSDCGEEYEPSPVEGSTAEIIREAGIETLSLKIPEGMDIIHLLPGQDGALYGPGEMNNGANDSGFLSAVRRATNRTMQPVQSKDGKSVITWDYGEAGITFVDRLDESFIKYLDHCYQGVNGDMTMSVGNLQSLLEDRLVVWVTKDRLNSVWPIQRNAIQRLMSMFGEAVWWAHGNVLQLDVLNMKFNHGFAKKKKNLLEGFKAAFDTDDCTVAGGENQYYAPYKYPDAHEMQDPQVAPPAAMPPGPPPPPPMAPNIIKF